VSKQVLGGEAPRKQFILFKKKMSLPLPTPAALKESLGLPVIKDRLRKKLIKDGHSKPIALMRRLTDDEEEELELWAREFDWELSFYYKELVYVQFVPMRK
jgi:hypothetical protein